MAVTLWRISNHQSLDGTGGVHTSGRWHTEGQPIVYCAPNPATALLEILVHWELGIDELPVSVRYLEVAVPDSQFTDRILPSVLGAFWRTNLDETRRVGDEWLRSGRSALLAVPCAIVPETWNVLINPMHPGAKRIRILRVHKQSLDDRLV
jgi:RES domain-containing protein